MTPSTIAAPIPQTTLRAVLRNPVELMPGDSLRRCLQLSRFESVAALPVTLNRRLLGMVFAADMTPILGFADLVEQEAAMARSVSEMMQPPAAILRSTMEMAEVRTVFAESGEPILPVLDEEDFYLGVVLASDLLAPELPSPRPARIGGMATPFGVYLTDGAIQAGAGNGALVATGMLMTILSMLAFGAVDIGFQALGWLLRRPIPLLVSLGDDVPVRDPALGLASIAEMLLVFVVFMLLMRLTRLVGYHAAEHQTVHAIERGERLTPGIVQRMPRAHPRCGTNLLAAVLIFMNVRQALGYFPIFAGPNAADIPAALTALFAWRPVGTFLQERFTTRPADDRELASGISAGQDLLTKYLNAPPARPSLLRRIWCSGMTQVVFGFTIPYTVIVVLILPRLDQIRQLILHR